MLRLVLRRLGTALLTALLASAVVFSLIRHVPGDVVAQLLGQSSDPQAAAALRGFFGLDQPVWRQYLQWLSHVVSGDLGTSWTQGKPVTSLVLNALGVTAELSIATLVVSTAIGVPLGVFAGMKEGSWLDRCVQSVNVLGISAPVFWTGLMLLFVVSSASGWSPPLTWSSPGESLSDNLAMLALPVASLAVLQAAAYGQFVRQGVVTASHQDYVRAAIAKGMPQRLVFFKHVLRNVSIPLVTFVGLILVQVLGGAVIVESLFGLPGLGRLLLTAIQNRDYPVLEGGLLVVVAISLAVTLIVDLLYRAIDPRVRLR